MSYTWTTGEVITADKLNATGGGTSYDLVLAETFTSEGHTLEGNGLSFDDIIDKIINGENVKVLYTSYSNSGYGNPYNSVSESTDCYVDIDPSTQDKNLTISGISSGNIMSLITYSDYTPNSVNICGINLYTFTYDSTTKEYTFTAA